MSYKIGDKLWDHIEMGPVAEVVGVEQEDYILEFDDAPGEYLRYDRDFVNKQFSKLLTPEESNVSDKANAKWKPLKEKVEYIPTPLSSNCTCGIAAIGGGIHSDYCDLGEAS